MSEETLQEQEEVKEERVTGEVAEDGAEHPGEATSEELSLEEQLENAKAEAAKNLDSFLRAQAELANARKRFEKQRAQVYANANAELAGKLLPVLDDFERALENVPPEISEDKWFSGIELVYRKLVTILENMNVESIEAVGQPFDPNYHEALGAETSDEYESGTVTREMLKGYQLDGRVIRPSLVYVAD